MNSKQLIIQSIVCGIICIACESHEQNADEAFKNYHVETVSEIDSSSIFKDSINRLLKKVNTKKTIKIDNSNKFKDFLEEKVKANNLLITHLKGLHQSSSKVYRKILKLENINNQFVIQLKDFEENMNKELNDLSLSIKEYELLNN